MTAPRTSVVLATCNRGESLMRAVRSILAIDEDFELVIVDQSEQAQPASFGARGTAGPTVVQCTMDRKGLAAARNEGIRRSHGDIIAMTDDDCEVPRGWLSSLQRVFERDDRIGMVFGNVVPSHFDRSRGFIPSYLRSEPFLGRSARHKNQIEGMGACMALRRELWARLGGFDEMLGVSRRFPAAEEGDFALRALRSGWHVFETPDVTVTHHGFRTWEEGKRLIPSYWYGTGAMFAKNLKLAPLSTLRLLAGLGWRSLAGRSSLTAESLGQVATRRARLTAFTGGLAAGLRCHVNHDAEIFEPRAARRVTQDPRLRRPLEY
jgi:GT2 family glycosyltransferase